MYRSMIERSWRARRIAFFWGMLCCMPALAFGNSIVVGNHLLQPNQAGQVVSLFMTGTDAYSSSDLGFLINGGFSGAPIITHVFGDTTAAIPTGNLAGSIWEGGLGGLGSSFPDGTSTAGTGFQTIVGFATPGHTLTTATGIYVTLTFSTVGVAPGVYSFSLTDHPTRQPQLIVGIEDFEPIFAPFDLTNGTLTVVPEPTSIVLGLFAIAGLAVAASRAWRTAR